MTRLIVESILSFVGGETVNCIAGENSILRTCCKGAVGKKGDKILAGIPEKAAIANGRGFWERFRACSFSRDTQLIWCELLCRLSLLFLRLNRPISSSAVYINILFDAVATLHIHLVDHYCSVHPIGTIILNLFFQYKPIERPDRNNSFWRLITYIATYNC